MGDDGPGDLALHDLPARPLLGGIVGAFVGSLVGAIVIGLIIYGAKVGTFRVPGQKATDIAVVLYAVPGALIGIATRCISQGDTPGTLRSLGFLYPRP